MSDPKRDTLEKIMRSYGIDPLTGRHEVFATGGNGGSYPLSGGGGSGTIPADLLRKSASPSLRMRYGSGQCDKCGAMEEERDRYRKLLEEVTTLLVDARKRIALMEMACGERREEYIARAQARREAKEADKPSETHERFSLLEVD